MTSKTRTPEQVDRDVWSKIDDSDPAGCWPWQGTLNRPGGFGQFYYHGKHGPHRWIMERLGHDTTNADVRHHCKNPVCCRPDHLYIYREQRS